MHLFSEYGEMNQKQIRLSQLYTLLGEQITILKKTASALALPWEGEANKTYLLRLEADFLRTEKTMDLLLQALILLKMAIEEYQKTENVIAQIIGDMTC